MDATNGDKEPNRPDAAPQHFALTLVRAWQAQLQHAETLWSEGRDQWERQVGDASKLASASADYALNLTRQWSAFGVEMARGTLDPTHAGK
ncbi:MAG: hypothetical protein AAF721_40900 [Myxococcota bacterium]